MDAETFWNNTKQMMKEQHQTQESMANSCGVNYSTYHSWIVRKILPDVISAYKIAKILGTTVERLVDGDEPTVEASSDVYKQKYESLLRAMIPILDAARADCENL